MRLDDGTAELARQQVGLACYSPEPASSLGQIRIRAGGDGKPISSNEMIAASLGILLRRSAAGAIILPTPQMDLRRSPGEATAADRT